MLNVMECERSIINMILLWLGYLVYNLDNRAITLSTKTGLKTWCSLELSPHLTWHVSLCAAVRVAGALHQGDGMHSGQWDCG